MLEVLKKEQTPVTDEQLAELKKLPMEVVWGAVKRLGYTDCHYSGMRSTRPKERLVGRALTIRYPHDTDGDPQLARAVAELAALMDAEPAPPDLSVRPSTAPPQLPTD